MRKHSSPMIEDEGPSFLMEEPRGHMFHGMQDNEKYIITALLALMFVMFLPASYGQSIPYVGGMIGLASKNITDVSLTKEVLGLLTAGIVLTWVHLPRHTEPLIGILLGYLVGRFI